MEKSMQILLICSLLVCYVSARPWPQFDNYGEATAAAAIAASTEHAVETTLPPEILPDLPPETPAPAVAQCVCNPDPNMGMPPVGPPDFSQLPPLGSASLLGSFMDGGMEPTFADPAGPPSFLYSSGLGLHSGPGNPLMSPPEMPMPIGDGMLNTHLKEAANSKTSKAKKKKPKTKGKDSANDKKGSKTKPPTQTDSKSKSKKTTTKPKPKAKTTKKPA